MVHKIMLLRVALKSGYIATRNAENVFSPAWSSRICSFRFVFALATCHKTCREGPHSSMVQHSMLLEVLVHTVLVATKHAVNGFTSVWIIGACFFRLNFGLVFLLFQVGLHTDHVGTKLADKGFSPVWLQTDHVIHF